MKTLKELYNLEYDKKPGNELYSLPQWFNKVIDKTPEELSVDDIGIMIRQDVVFDLALDKAIELLADDPLSGYQYEGEILASLSRHESYTEAQKKKITTLISKLETFADNHEFEVDEFKDDYLNDLNNLKLKL